MKLTSIRKWLTDKSTTSELYFEEIFFGYVLEDKVRTKKIPHVTAIPEGTYEISWHMSPKFGKLMPMLIGVPGYEYVYIHNGNDAEDTDGCLLVGYTKEKDFVGRSKDAFSDIYLLLAKALTAHEKVFITIITAPDVEDTRTSHD
jgi:hypothetical protein